MNAQASAYFGESLSISDIVDQQFSACGFQIVFHEIYVYGVFGVAFKPRRAVLERHNQRVVEKVVHNWARARNGARRCA